MSTPKVVLVLVTLVCGSGILTAEGQDVRAEIQRLLEVAEEIDENVEDLEDDVDDIGDEIDNLEDEIEDFGEGIEDMETDMETVTAEVENLREEVKTTRSVLQTGQQDIGQKMTELVEEVARNGNYTWCLKQDTQTIKDELTDIETAVDGLRNDLDTKVEGLKGHHLQELEHIKKQQDALKSSLEEELAELKHCTLVLANNTETDLEEMKRELTELSINQTENYREVKEELTSLQRDMNSTLYILQELKNQLITTRQQNLTGHQNNLAGYCNELHPTSLSGYYWLRGPSERVYCDMDRQSCGCGNPWGWMRVANIDMTDPKQQCPEGFRLTAGTTKRMCETIADDHPHTGKCVSIAAPTHSVRYSRVCGRIRAYQYASPNAFIPYHIYRYLTIDDGYVNGVSITHGQSPRKHIWTLAAALDETRSDRDVCPCTKATATYIGAVPPFIGNDYFCDTGSRQRRQSRLYTEDPLWDGEGCGPTSSCCQFNSPPWFCKELPQPTIDDIEVRVCRNRERSNEDTPFDLIEIYVQ